MLTVSNIRANRTFVIVKKLQCECRSLLPSGGARRRGQHDVFRAIKQHCFSSAISNEHSKTSSTGPSKLEGSGSPSRLPKAFESRDDLNQRPFVLLFRPVTTILQFEEYLIDKRCPAFPAFLFGLADSVVRRDEKSATPGKSGGGVWHVRGQGKGGRA